MGVFINTLISGAVTQKEWEPVYEESLFMAKELKLLDIEKVDVCGREMYCAVPTHEYTQKTWDDKEHIGWRASGNLVTLRRAEPHYTPRSFDDDSIECECKCDDALIQLVPQYAGYMYNDPEAEKFYCCHSIWGAKTQGEPYHMLLLAIGCMIEARLGKHAIVDGDITRGQCVKAIEIANDVLGEKLELPVRCDAKRLIKRVGDLPITDLEKLSVVIGAYLGTEGNAFGQLIRENFDDAIIKKYWKEKVGAYEPDMYGFTRAMNSYFLMGFGLSDFCDFAKFDAKDAEKCKELMKGLMDTAMYLPDKDCEDFIAIDKEAEEAYGIGQALAQIFLVSAKNKHIDRYIPLDEFRLVFREKYGSTLDTDAWLDSYIEAEGKKAANKDDVDPDEHELFSLYAKGWTEKREEDMKKYDVCEYDDLEHYTKGASISPDLKTAIKKSYDFYMSTCNEERFKELKDKSPEDMIDYIVARNTQVVMTREEWEKIFAIIREHPENFSRYYGMVRVRITDDSLYLMRVLTLNDDFWDYCKTLPPVG